MMTQGRRLATDILIGGAAVLVVGYVMFTLPPLRDYYARALTAGSAMGVARDQPLWWAVAIGACAYSALVTLAISAQVAPVSPLKGLGIGALVGALLWITSDFMLHGVSHVGTFATALIGSMLEMVPGAIAGWVIAILEGRRRHAFG